MHKVTIKNSGHTFDVRPSQTVLQAAIEAGINLPYGCRNGACGACKAKLLQGKVMHDDYQGSAMSDAELAAGNALLCCARPMEDLSIECREVGGLAGIKPRILPARVAKKEQLAHDVIALHLQLPASERLQFKAGQYIEFILKDGKRRAFSIANAPHDSDFLQLHIRVIAGGVFSEYVEKELQEKAILRLEAPFGSFFLREDSQRPIIMVAGGTGFAPVKGMIEHMLHNNIQRDIVLYRGARQLRDLYMHDLCEKWADLTPNITYIPVLSEPAENDNWQGKTGLVHQAVLDDFEVLSQHQAYVCGAPGMCEIAHQTFIQQGLDTEEFFSDAFTFAAAPKI
ncbi:MAG: CDP-6-deoxy-delta-3,4-glucoseen reductase [Proteobacteria bacterium ST_bin12]|nr:MAG: CDP-6-deoxy-delta-3,4-glucoseen reductase [Proteobacteria bacterium ST_bin12]